MSQQSNPATLREALAEIIVDLRRREKRNLNSAHASLRGFAEAAGYAADQLEKVAALAASGTEAAPSVTVSTGAPPGTVSSFSEPKWKEYPEEVPAQAAASPEGEGRETPEEYKFNCEWKLVPSNRPVDGIDPDDVTKEFVYELPGETRVNGNVGAWYQSAVYWKHRALRQSAAPSGGAAHLPSVSELSEYLQDVEGWDEHYIAEECLKAIKLWLAQESKTGAVTETK